MVWMEWRGGGTSKDFLGGVACLLVMASNNQGMESVQKKFRHNHRTTCAESYLRKLYFGCRGRSSFLSYSTSLSRLSPVAVGFDDADDGDLAPCELVSNFCVGASVPAPQAKLRSQVSWL